MESFKYLGWILHQADEDWPAFLRNIWRARKVWGKLGKFLRREGGEPIISEKFYRAVVQEVLLFGSETWVLTAAMLQNLKGVHVGFLRQVTRMKAQRLGEETWRKAGAGRVLQATGTKPIREYISKRQAMVSEWVVFWYAGTKTGDARVGG